MKILVVEDNAATRELLERSLEEAGHSVVVAVDLATASPLALEGAFDLAIVDVTLPDGSGLDLCRAVRSQRRYLPILFLTARGEVEDRIAGLDAGGDDYLRKPFALAELRARIRALGRRAGPVPPMRITSGTTSIDLSARRLARDGREVMLTAREWAVLEVLAANAGQVVSRADVIASAWPRPGAGASESLDVIVSRLRRKLGGDGNQGPHIRTVRGKGFAFEVPS
jgi:DNA-binding response OmpR family regulator